MRTAIVGYAERDSAPDGIVLTLVRGLRQAGHDCMLIWILPEGAGDFCPPPCTGVEVHYVATGRADDPREGEQESVGERIAAILRQFDIVYSAPQDCPALPAMLERIAARRSVPYFVSVSDRPADLRDDGCPDCSAHTPCRCVGAQCQWSHSDCVVCIAALPFPDRALTRVGLRARADYRIVLSDRAWCPAVHHEIAAAARAIAAKRAAPKVISRPVVVGLDHSGGDRPAGADAGSRRLRLLLLIGTWPEPPLSGALLRWWAMIRYLGTRHDLTLVALLWPGQAGNCNEVLGYCSAVHAVGHGDGPGPDEQALPYLVALRASGNMRDVLASIDTGRFDVALVEQIYLAPYAEHLRCPVILGEQNIESSLINMAVANGLGHLFPPEFPDPRSEPDRLRNYEDRIWPQFAVRTAVSEPERQEIQRRASVGRTVLVENGTDPDLWLQDARQDTGTVMFVGLLNYLPNVDAVQHLLQDIWPHLLRHDRSLRLLVAGRDPAREVREVCDQAGVRLLPNPADLRTVARQASLSVVPLRVGAGSRIKILDSMALGLPVVTTQVGCSGLAVVDEEHLLVRDDPRDFAAAVFRVLTDAALWQGLRERGRRLVRERYAWDRTLQPLETAISELAREGRPASGDGVAQG